MSGTATGEGSVSSDDLSAQSVENIFHLNFSVVWIGSRQWRWKTVEFRGAEARRYAALPCFSPTNIELFIATNSPDDSLLLTWVHSDSLPSDSDKLSTSTLLSILHLFDA